MRLPLGYNIESRDGLLTKGAKCANLLLEPSGQSLAVRSRPGITDQGLIVAGTAQLLTPWAGISGIINDKFFNRSVCGGAVASPTIVTALSPATVATGAWPLGIVISPNGASAYVANNTDSTISQYSRNTTTGVLTALTPATVVANSVPYGICVSPDGAFVYAASGGANRGINQYSRNATTGALTFLSLATITPPNLYGEQIQISPDGLGVYLSSGGYTNVMWFTRNAGTGLLTYSSNIDAVEQIQDKSMIISPDGKNVYVSSGNVTSPSRSIKTYTRNATTQALTLFQTVALGSTGNGIAISPNNLFLYCARNSAKTIAQYSRNATTGALTALSPDSVATGLIADNVVPLVSSDGLYLYLAAEPSNVFFRFDLDATTGLITATTTQYPVGGFPSNIVNAPDGTSFYVVNTNDSTVSQFSISSSLVSLTPTTTGLQYTAQDNGANAFEAYLMFKNSTQAWSLGSQAGSVPTLITDVNFPGSYTVTLTGLTRSGTVATATTPVDTNFQVGSSVTIAGATPAAYNGAQTITGVTPSSSTTIGPIEIVSITRASTTATVITKEIHGFTNGMSIIIAGATEPAYNGTYTIVWISATSFSYTLTTSGGVSTTTGIVSTGVAVTVSRSGATATAVSTTNHGLVNGSTITIAGANETPYNGTYVATVIGPTRFSYQITVTGASTTYAGAVTNASISSMSRVGGLVTATTGAAHGLVASNTAEGTGVYVTISGASQSQYNGTFFANIASTTVFTFSLPVTPVDTPASPVDGRLSYFVNGPALNATFVLTAGNATGTWNITMSAVPADIVNGTYVTIGGGSTPIGTQYLVSAVTGTTFDATNSVSINGIARNFTAVALSRTYINSSLTASGTTATYTSAAAHGLSTGNTVNVVAISYAIADYPLFSPYLGQKSITVTGATTFTYTVTVVAGTPTTPATGTLLLNSLGVPTTSIGTPTTPASGAITVTSIGLTTTTGVTPATPAAGTLTALYSLIISPSFTYTVSGSPATPATGTITAAGGRSTVPGIGYINGYFVVMDIYGVIYTSAPDNPRSWVALDYTIAQNETGDGVYLGKTQSYIAAFKENSTEFFYDAQNPIGSPLSPVDNGFTQVGCASAGSVAKLGEAYFWISKSKNVRGRSVHTMVGTQQKKISTPDIDRILNLDSLASVFSYGIKLEGHSLYVLTLVTTNLTLVYDVEANAWSQWTSLTIAASKSVTSITLSGTTATVTATAHGLSDGDPVKISGATQTGYNGIWQASYVSANVFTIEVAAGLTTPATGTILMFPYTESYFKFTHYASCSDADLLLHESTGRMYQLYSSIYQDALVPILQFVRTSILDGQSLGYKNIARVFFIGNRITDSIMIRHSDDDSQTFTAYRPMSLNDKRPQVRRSKRFFRRSHELKYIGNNPLIGTHLELEL